MLRERKENRNFFAIRGDIRKSYNIIYYELKELIKKNKLIFDYTKNFNKIQPISHELDQSPNYYQEMFSIVQIVLLSNRKLLEAFTPKDIDKVKKFEKRYGIIIDGLVLIGIGFFLIFFTITNELSENERNILTVLGVLIILFGGIKLFCAIKYAFLIKKTSHQLLKVHNLRQVLHYTILYPITYNPVSLTTRRPKQSI